MGGAGGGEHEGFGAGVDGAVAVVQHQGTQLFANGSAAGFAGAQHGKSPRLKGVREPGGLGGLARSVPAFEGDEKTWALNTHWTSLPIPGHTRRLSSTAAPDYAETMSLSDQHAADLSPETVVVAAGRPERAHDEPVNPPIVLSSTYFGTGSLDDGDRGYGRYANPTWDPFEDALAKLEGATLPGLLYASGLAAVSSALSLVPAGGVVVMPSHSYAGSLVMAAELAEKGFLELRTVDIADTDAVKALIDPGNGKKADLLWLESPTNPMLGIADVRALTDAAHAVGAIVVTDNTFSTPLVQQPLSLGSDVVLHSVTKYLAGHSDVVLGALVTSNPELRATLLHHRIIHGGIAGPFEAWLALRGLRTLALRIERSQASAATLAERLSTHPRVEDHPVTRAFPPIPGTSAPRYR
jgi:cystathionine gamma-synthase